VFAQVPSIPAPGVFDHALIGALVLLSLGEAWWYWPRVMRALADGVPGTRVRAYRIMIALEWGFTIAVAAWWIVQHRAWDLLHIAPGRPLGTAVGAVLVVAYIALMLVQVRALVANPDRLAGFAERQAKMDPLVPRTADEHRVFRVLAVTAGICEEFLYSGFALWYFTAPTGPVIGFALAAVFFGVGHLYLGYMHVVRTTIVGVLFGCIVVGTGSLWLAIVLHAAMDLVGGEVGSRAFRLAAERAAGRGTAPA